MSQTIIAQNIPQLQVFSVASKMAPSERQSLAIQALAKTEPISELAKKNRVSRKFIYKQADIGQEALEDAFEPKKDDSDVLFYLPVTKHWLRQFVLVLVFLCHSSFRGIIQAASALLDTHISIGRVHNIVSDVVEEARKINVNEDPSLIKVGAQDEIFQARKPVLAGIDVHSTYCYLLALEEARDGDTWGVHLLDLQERGFNPDYIIADGGLGLRAGWKEVFPDKGCHGDVFHPLHDLGKLVTHLENRAMGAISTRQKLEQKMGRAKKKGEGNKLSKKLAVARIAESQFVELASDVATLANWMREDVLSVVGPELESRKELFDFVVAELKQREHLLRHRIKPIRTYLENQRDELLAFVALIDEQLASLAQEYRVSSYLVRKIYELQGLSETDNRYWRMEGKLRGALRKLFDPIQAKVQDIISGAVRASSIVENFNSRLRNYFFLRRHLGPEYLDLLRFVLNHNRLRSEHPRTGWEESCRIAHRL